MTLVAVGIAHPRVAAAVDELLAGEDRYEVRHIRGSAVPRNAALAIVDAPFLERSARPLALAAVVIVGTEADRDALGSRAPGARAWLRTSSTGDELLGAVEAALREPAAVAPGADAVADAEAVATAGGVIGPTLLATAGAAAGTVALAMLWQALRP